MVLFIAATAAAGIAAPAGVEYAHNQPCAQLVTCQGGRRKIGASKPALREGQILTEYQAPLAIFQNHAAHAISGHALRHLCGL